jgi:hypothetical protein
MKCSICSLDLAGDGFVLTYVAHGDTYCATVHLVCLEEKVGLGIVRRLRNLAFVSGWRQLGLPLLNEQR